MALVIAGNDAFFPRLMKLPLAIEYQSYNYICYHWTSMFPVVLNKNRRSASGVLPPGSNPWARVVPTSGCAAIGGGGLNTAVGGESIVTIDCDSMTDEDVRIETVIGGVGGVPSGGGGLPIRSGGGSTRSGGATSTGDEGRLTLRV